MCVLEDHKYGVGTGPRLDRLRDGGEQLRLGCEPAQIKEVGLAQQLRQHLPPWPVRRHVRRRAATPRHIEVRVPSHRLRCFGEAGLSDAWLAEHDRHPSPTDPGVPDQSRHGGQFLLTAHQGLFLDPHPTMVSGIHRTREYSSDDRSWNSWSDDARLAGQQARRVAIHIKWRSLGTSVGG